MTNAGVGQCTDHGALPTVRRSALVGPMPTGSVPVTRRADIEPAVFPSDVEKVLVTTRAADRRVRRIAAPQIRQRRGQHGVAAVLAMEGQPRTQDVGLDGFAVGIEDPAVGKVASAFGGRISLGLVVHVASFMQATPWNLDSDNSHDAHRAGLRGPYLRTDPHATA